MMDKNPRIRIPKLLQASSGRPCANCDAQDGTVVRAHYTGLRQQVYGKGMGHKGHDLVSADLCRKCHTAFDRYLNGDMTYEKKIDLSEQFLHCCMMTLIRDWREGVIK